MQKCLEFAKLIRLHKPAGILLLLWPTWWALWLSAPPHPSLQNFIVFTLGVIIMRSAGVVINDICDKDFDKHVCRTRERPLTAGKLKLHDAWLCLCVLCTCAASLLFFLNPFARYLSLVALLFAGIYPLMKRFFKFPQFILGIAFSMSILLAYANTCNTLPLNAWLLFIANLCWTFAYDTYYAMSDAADDVNIGIHSSALSLGRWQHGVTQLLQACFLLLMISIGILQGLSLIYYLSLGGSGVYFIYQAWLAKRDPLRAFLHNQWLGLGVFLGIVLR